MKSTNNVLEYACIFFLNVICYFMWTSFVLLLYNLFIRSIQNVLFFMHFSVECHLLLYVDFVLLLYNLFIRSIQNMLFFMHFSVECQLLLYVDFVLLLFDFLSSGPSQMPVLRQIFESSPVALRYGNCTLVFLNCSMLL
jgi:hypothetical protein